MSERTDHPPSTEASTRQKVVRRGIIGGAAGVALLVGPVLLANVIVPRDDADADRVEASASESATSLINLRRQSSEADRARAGASLSMRTTTTAPPTTTTTVPPTTTTTTAPPTTTTTTAPPPPPDTTPPPPDSGGGLGDPSNYATWDALAECESGGNWAINTGNGYYGGLQFSLSSWQAVGGSGLPSDASRETQIAMGQRLYERQGWGAWPYCTSQLGFR